MALSTRSDGRRNSEAMLKKLIKTGIATAALAASAILIAAPASAQAWGNQGFYNVNQYQQSPRQVKRLKLRAIDACICQLDYDAAAYGYRDARAVDYVAEQIGPRRFKVYTKAKLFDGYNYNVTNFDCVVRRGEVVRSTPIQPIAYKFQQNRRGFGGRGFRNDRIRNSSFGLGF